MCLSTNRISFQLKKRILPRQGWNLCCGHLAMGVVSEALVWSACPWGLLCDVALGFWPQDGVGRKELGQRVWFLLSAALTVWSWKGRQSLDLSAPQLLAV